MANETTASVVQYGGHGSRNVGVFHSVGAPRSPILRFILTEEVVKGVASAILGILGARKAGASVSEAAAAASNTAMSSTSVKTLTTGAWTIAMAPTTEAFQRVDPDLMDLQRLVTDEITYALESLLSYDATMGAATYLPSLASTIVGTSGAALVPATGLNAFKSLQTAVGTTGIDAIWVVDASGRYQLQNYGLGTAASLLATPAGSNQFFLDLLESQGVDSAGYLTSWGNIHIFEEQKPGGLYATGGDTYSPMFIPAIAGLNGIPLPPGAKMRQAAMQRMLPDQRPLAPAYALGFRADPALAARLVAAPGPLNRRVETATGIPIDIVGRSYAGQNLAIIDGWLMVTLIEVSDLSHVAVRYLT